MNRSGRLHRSVMFFGLGIALLGGAVGILWGQTSKPAPHALKEAKPIVTWNPASLTQTVSPGETKTVSVSFVSSKNVRRASVQISPELISFVRAEPGFLERIRKGESSTLNLIVAPFGGATLGTFAGTIQLRKEEGEKDEDEEPGDRGKTLPQTLKITVNVWASVSGDGFSVKLPPSFAVAPLAVDGVIRLQNFVPTENQIVAPGEIFIEVFKSTPQDIGDVRSHVSVTKEFTIDGGFGVRGVRRDPFVSQLPGFDQYLSKNGFVWVLAGTHAQNDQAAISVIEHVMDSLRVP